MAKRQLQRIDTSSVQGEGSYIILRVSWGDVMRLRHRAVSGEFDEEADTQAILSQSIVEWNWVDDNGELLPLPREDADVIDQLLLSEINFLVSAILGDEGNEKN